MTVDTDQGPIAPRTADEFRAHRRRVIAGWVVGSVALVLVALPAAVALLLGLDASSDQCVDPPTFDAPACKNAPGAFAVLVTLLALPPLLGVLTARPRRAMRTVAAIGTVALLAYAILLFAL
ncbi:hypothetical protein [Cellulosimicrobium sp. SH8]|uniref:hypothetical protein n=1 Tax=Cellulosimicrobium sp. SH8 TaxID=2952936 RepID=UPI0021F35C13|nr:hypothetical protein [Cellulosimicrobium sp. SH8]